MRLLWCLNYNWFFNKYLRVGPTGSFATSTVYSGGIKKCFMNTKGKIKSTEVLSKKHYFQQLCLGSKNARSKRWGMQWRMRLLQQLVAGLGRRGASFLLGISSMTSLSYSLTVLEAGVNWVRGRGQQNLLNKTNQTL